MGLLFPTPEEVALAEAKGEPDTIGGAPAAIDVPAPEVDLPGEDMIDDNVIEFDPPPGTNITPAVVETVVDAVLKSNMPGSKDALFSSARTGEGNDNWGTPDWLFNFLASNFGPFTTDTCADAANTKVEGSFYDEAQDGLAQTWEGKCWCNPPYSNVAAWVRKAYESVYVAQTADRVVLLVANRTETEWFHEYGVKGLVFFLKTRVAFVEPKDMAPAIDKKTGLPKKRSSPTFGSMVIVFDRNIDDDKRPEIAGTRVMIAQAVDWTDLKPKTAKKVKA